MDWTQKHVQKPSKFDLEVKGQRRIGIMNVRDKYTHVPACLNNPLLKFVYC